MSRYIDAEKIDFNEVFPGDSDYAKEIREAAQGLLDAQPTVTIEDLWIPVDTPPKESGKYLITTETGAVYFQHYYKSLEDETGWWSDRRMVVVAWMPFPKPYMWMW